MAGEPLVASGILSFRNFVLSITILPEQNRCASQPFLPKERSRNKNSDEEVESIDCHSENP
jgi:hypothetical protein